MGVSSAMGIEADCIAGAGMGVAGTTTTVRARFFGGEVGAAAEGDEVTVAAGASPLVAALRFLLLLVFGVGAAAAAAEAEAETEADSAGTRAAAVDLLARVVGAMAARCSNLAEDRSSVVVQ